MVKIFTVFILISTISLYLSYSKGIENTSPSRFEIPGDSLSYYSLKRKKGKHELHKNSLDTINEISWKDIFEGFSYYNAWTKTTYATNPPLEMLNFNTVEGLNITIGLKFLKGYQEEKKFTATTYYRYGFSNRRHNIRSSVKWGFGPSNRHFVELEGGRYVMQFNNENPIHSSINTYYSLLYRKNYMKLYGSNFGKIKLKLELFDGIYLEPSLLYEDREPLKNTSNFSFLKENPEANIQYTSNDPVDFAETENVFSRHQALLLDVKLRILFREQYISVLDKNISLGSDYPNITLRYKTGMRALGSDVNYHFAGINVGQSLDYGFYGVSSWDVNAGTFFNVRSIEFIDYQHFNGNQTHFISYPEPYEEDRTPLNRFQLLDYYKYSVRESFWAVHFEHHFKGFLTKKIPFLKNAEVQSVIGLNFLQTSNDIVHFEFTSGLENIFRIFRVDLVTGYNNAEKIKGAVRLSMLLHK